MQAEINILNKIRKKIDSIDKKISNLLIKRAREIFKIKKFKKQKTLALTDLSREREILDKCNSRYEKIIFKAIIMASKKLQMINNDQGNLKKKRKSAKI